MTRREVSNMTGCAAIVILFSLNLAAKDATDLMADQADAVVVGEIESGQQTGQDVAFTLSIIRSLKGELSLGTTVNLTGPQMSVPMTRSLNGQYGLWFLKKSGSRWTFLPLIQHGVSLESSGYIPLQKTTSPAAIAMSLSPTSIGDQMALEIVAALQSYTDSTQLYYLALHLSRIGASAIRPALYHTLGTNSDPQLKLVGLAGQLGGPDEIAALNELSRNTDQIPKMRAISLLEVAISGVRSADPGAVPPLGILSSSTNPDVQRCAAMALENIHSRDALPFLARLLDAPDQKTREAAIAGLSRFVDNLPIQTIQNTLNFGSLSPQGPTPYRTSETDRYSLSHGQLGSGNETDYVQFWKSWWAANQSKLTTAGQ